MIAVDWGTTAFRAYAVSGGRITSRHERPVGVMALADGTHAAILGEAVQTLGPAGAIVLSGMVGSRQGWREVPYARCPADARSIAAGALSWLEPGLGRVHLLPGLITTGSLGLPDVMRGEETQILGAIHAAGRRDATVILPGTHSKHARVRDSRITGFETLMTGEVFAALSAHTILSRLMEETAQGPTGEGFRRGVEAGAAPGHPASLLHRIFMTRTLGLVGDLPGGELADFLSGVLIGAELASLDPDIGPALVVGSPALTARYGTAAALMGRAIEPAAPDCVVIGQGLVMAALSPA